MTLHETEHHGTRLWWSDQPGPFTGTLVFGVGTIDEPVHLAGITHLVEHLVFRALGPAYWMGEGMTGAAAVELSMTGEPEVVSAFLGQVAEVVRTLPFTASDLHKELRAIRAETPSTVAWERALLGMRYGATGLGGGTSGTPALPAVTLDEVRDWGQRWFVASNAVLVFSGQPPAGLDVRLPDGRPVHPPAARPIVTERTLVLSRKSGVALQLVLPWHHTHLVANALAHELWMALRHEQPLIYGPSIDGTRVDGDHHALDVVLDPLDGDVLATLRALVTLLRRLERDGLDPAACEVSRDRDRVETAQPESARAFHHARARALLRGWPEDETIEQYRTRTAAISDETLSTVLREALSTVVVSVEAEAVFDGDLDPKELAKELGMQLDDGQPWEKVDEAPRGRKHRVRGHRRSWAAVSDGALLDGEGRRVVGRFDLREVTLAVREADGITLVDRHGRSISVGVEDWRRGDRFIAEVLAVVPAAVVRDVPAWPTLESVAAGER